jgi:hypothetical protein
MPSILLLPGWRDEEHADWTEVGARILRTLDPRGLYRLRREDGAHHQDIQHTGQFYELPSPPYNLHLRRKIINESSLQDIN